MSSGPLCWLSIAGGMVRFRQTQMGGLWTGIRPEHISVISKMVSDYSGMMVQPHKVSRQYSRRSKHQHHAPCGTTFDIHTLQLLHQQCGLSSWWTVHNGRDAAGTGDCGCQRLRSRVWHSPGRHAEEPRHVRDHAAGAHRQVPRRRCRCAAQPLVCMPAAACLLRHSHLTRKAVIMVLHSSRDHRAAVGMQAW